MTRPNEPVVLCPSCGDPILIQEINCAIFRHGVFKQTGQQMDPHSPKELCDAVHANGEIFGCGKPFRIIVKNGAFEAEHCDYL